MVSILPIIKKVTILTCMLLLIFIIWTVRIFGLFHLFITQKQKHIWWLYRKWLKNKWKSWKRIDMLYWKMCWKNYNHFRLLIWTKKVNYHLCVSKPNHFTGLMLRMLVYLTLVKRFWKTHKMDCLNTIQMVWFLHTPYLVLVRRKQVNQVQIKKLLGNILSNGNRQSIIRLTS